MQNINKLVFTRDSPLIPKYIIDYCDTGEYLQGLIPQILNPESLIIFHYPLPFAREDMGFFIASLVSDLNFNATNAGIVYLNTKPLSFEIQKTQFLFQKQIVPSDNNLTFQSTYMFSPISDLSFFGKILDDAMSGDLTDALIFLNQTTILRFIRTGCDVIILDEKLKRIFTDNALAGRYGPIRKRVRSKKAQIRWQKFYDEGSNLVDLESFAPPRE